MKTKTRTLVILLVTLLMGMLIGSLLHGNVMKRRMEKHFRELRHPRGFISRMDDILELEGSQKEKIHEILKSHHKLLDEHRSQLDAIVDSLKVDLRKHLTEEQIKKLEERGPRRRFPGGPPGGPRGKGGPPPDSFRDKKQPWY